MPTITHCPHRGKETEAGKRRDRWRERVPDEFPGWKYKDDAERLLMADALTYFVVGFAVLAAVLLGYLA